MKYFRREAKSHQVFSQKVLQYYQQITPPTTLPKEVVTMNPFSNPDTFQLTRQFYEKYYGDNHPRYICFGINPGRFGAGVTGIPFTDPIRLETVCEIPNHLEKKAELSSKFIYEVIDHYGGPKKFYQHFYISAVSPLGFMRNNINLNYYDIKDHLKIFESYAVAQIEYQLEFGLHTHKAFSIGKGQNIKFLRYLNDKHKFFKEIIPLSHPRWVMQYRLKRKDEFLEEYLQRLKFSLQ